MHFGMKNFLCVNFQGIFVILFRNQKNKTLMRCSICHKEIKGCGNNAEPIKKGYCCDVCNYLYVLPKRLQIMRERK